MAGPSGGRPLRDPGDVEEPPGGPFRTWRSLYAAVLVYTGLAVAVLWILTHLLDVAPP